MPVSQHGVDVFTESLKAM